MPPSPACLHHAHVCNTHFTTRSKVVTTAAQLQRASQHCCTSRTGLLPMQPTASQLSSHHGTVISQHTQNPRSHGSASRSALGASHAHQHPPASPPLVVTAELDAHAHALFERLHKQHFPPERAKVGAHLTMFHALPGDLEPQVLQHLRELAATQRPISGTADQVQHLGHGVAYHIQAPALLGLRRSIANKWQQHLTRQDGAPWRNPHVTVQNKVAPDVAGALLDELLAEFEAFPVRIEGLRVWRYMGGPWEEVEHLPFGGAAPLVLIDRSAFGC